mgnify:CR=1 FL=1
MTRSHLENISNCKTPATEECRTDGESGRGRDGDDQKERVKQVVGWRGGREDSYLCDKMLD